MLTGHGTRYTSGSWLSCRNAEIEAFARLNDRYPYFLADTHRSIADTSFLKDELLF
jgi:hypothetical protein